MKYVLALFLIAGALAGTRIGAAVQRRITARSVRKYFAFVVLAAVGMVLFKLAMLLSGSPTAG